MNYEHRNLTFMMCFFRSGSSSISSLVSISWSQSRSSASRLRSCRGVRPTRLPPWTKGGSAESDGGQPARGSDGRDEPNDDIPSSGHRECCEKSASSSCKNIKSSAYMNSPTHYPCNYRSIYNKRNIKPMLNTFWNIPFFALLGLLRTRIRVCLNLSRRHGC